MLLLDEPTNHLDAESVAWLERFLQDYTGTVVAITHDRYFLDNAAGWILELDRGEGIPWEGNYSSWLEQKDARLQQESATESARQKPLPKNLSGYAKAVKVVNQKVRRVWLDLKSLIPTITKNVTKPTNCSFRLNAFR